MSLKKYLPILQWLPQYGRQELKGDLGAGITVGVMLIPQGMAYAMLAGMPPIYGLYASIIPLILYGIFGTSRQLAVGPVAMVALLIAAGIGQLAAPGSPEFISLALLTALLVGVIQLMLGLVRLGFLVNFLSHPVISGFTSAAALIIGFSQLKHLLGVKLPRSHHVHEIIMSAVQKLGEVHVPTLILGVVAIGLILLVKKYKFPIPGPLVAVIVGTLAVVTLGLESGGMKIVGTVPQGLPAFRMPALDFGVLGSLLPLALTISLVGFMESIAVAKAIQRKHKTYEIDPNQELIGLGLANIGGSFFQAFPTTGGFSRTAVNDQAGAKTGMASIISALLIGLTLLFLTPLFYYLPNAILASVIMVAVFGLINIKEAVHLWHVDKTDFAMLAVTFVATLSLGIETGIGIGVILSLVMVIYRSAYPHVAELGNLPGTNQYRNLKRYPEAESPDDVLIVRLDAPLYFANVNFFQSTLTELEKSKGEHLRLVILNAEAIVNLDSSGVHLLEELVQNYQERGIRLMISGANGPLRDILFKTGLVNLIGEANCFLQVDDAIHAWSVSPAPPKNPEQDHSAPHALQTNIIVSH